MLLEYDQMVDQPLKDRYEFADLHTLLGVKMGADDNDIHRAHKQLLLQYHQDTTASIGLVVIIDSCFVVVLRFYTSKSIFTDTGRGASMDDRLRFGSRPAIVVGP